MNIQFSRFGIGLLCLCWLLQSSSALAHSPGLSSMELSIKPNDIDVKITYALHDIEAFSPMDSDLDAEVSDAEREAAKPAIAKLLAEKLRINVDTQDYLPAEPGRVNFDEQNNAHVEFRYPAALKKSLLVESKLLLLLPEGHQQYVAITDINQQILAEKMLVKNDHQISLAVEIPADGKPPASGQTSFATIIDFYELGIEHIITGYDHLLFLFALLAVTHRFWPAIKIITSFTVAHSITLACAGLNLLELPSSFVEPFIAATIVYVGVENLIRGDHPKGRYWLAFGFGLIHGFGFASVLREMEISWGDTGILVPLVSFNLGIETGQIAVASVVLPLIWWLNNKPAIAGKFLKTGSLLVSLIGAYWFLERTVL